MAETSVCFNQQNDDETQSLTLLGKAGYFDGISHKEILISDDRSNVPMLQ